MLELTTAANLVMLVATLSPAQLDKLHVVAIQGTTSSTQSHDRRDEELDVEVGHLLLEKLGWKDLALVMRHSSLKRIIIIIMLIVITMKRKYLAARLHVPPLLQEVVEVLHAVVPAEDGVVRLILWRHSIVCCMIHLFIWNRCVQNLLFLRSATLHALLWELLLKGNYIKYIG